jgi:hypothetical protein
MNVEVVVNWIQESIETEADGHGENQGNGEDQHLATIKDAASGNHPKKY